jgi:hypothetical protein
LLWAILAGQPVRIIAPFARRQRQRSTSWHKLTESLASWSKPRARAA